MDDPRAVGEAKGEAKGGRSIAVLVEIRAPAAQRSLRLTGVYPNRGVPPARPRGVTMKEEADGTIHITHYHIHPSPEVLHAEVVRLITTQPPYVALEGLSRMAELVRPCLTGFTLDGTRERPGDVGFCSGVARKRDKAILAFINAAILQVAAQIAAERNRRDPDRCCDCSVM